MAAYVKTLEYIDVMRMLRHLVRVSELFTVYEDEVTDACFRIPEGGLYEDNDFMELPLLFIWQSLKLYYKTQQATEPPTQSLLTHYVQEVLRTGVPCSQALSERLFNPDPTVGFIAFMFAGSDESMNIATGTPLIKDFLSERIVVKGLNSIKTFGNDLRQRSITDRLQQLSDAASRIDSLGVSCVPELLIPEQSFFDSLDPDAPLLTTGVPFIDLAIGGGQDKGECNAIYGATGAGKTTLGIQMAVGSAKESFAHTPEGEHPELVLYYTYEQSRTNLWPRFVSAGAEIQRDTVQFTKGSVQGLKDPSTDASNLKPYEYERQHNKSVRLSELDRFREFTRWANQTLVIRNMSGAPDKGDTPEQRRIKEQMGLGGIEEICEDVGRVCSTFGAKVRVIFIDYISLVGQRQLGLKVIDKDTEYQFLKTAGDKVRYKLAAKYNCTVWLLHQLSGSANGRGPLYKPTIADAEGCKSLSNNLSNCLILGVPDQTPHDGGGAMSRLVCVKHRNSGTTAASDGLIVQHDKYLWKMNDVSGLWRADQSSKQFQRRGGAESDYVNRGN